MRYRVFTLQEGKNPSIQIVKFYGIVPIRHILYYIVFVLVPPFTKCIFKLISIQVTVLLRYR